MSRPVLLFLASICNGVINSFIPEICWSQSFYEIVSLLLFYHCDKTPEPGSLGGCHVRGAVVSNGAHGISPTRQQSYDGAPWRGTTLGNGLLPLASVLLLCFPCLLLSCSFCIWQGVMIMGKNPTVFSIM